MIAPPGTAATRRTQAERSAATQARLLDATIECLVERGWAATSTTEIVRRAGVSRGAQVHHFPTKEDLVLAALEHLLERRIEEFETTFANLAPEQRTPANAMRLLHENCFSDSFEAWLELVVAARTDPALHARFVGLEARFFENALATFRKIFPDALLDRSSPASVCACRSACSKGLSLGRLRGLQAGELDAVLEAFNAITAPYFPHNPGGRS